MSYQPIEHRGLISNMHTAALVNVAQAFTHQSLIAVAFAFDHVMRSRT